MMDRTPGERMADAAERQADAVEAILALLVDRLPAPKQRERQARERVEPVHVTPPVDVEWPDEASQGVYVLLERLAQVNASRTRKHVRPVKARAVLAACEDYPAKDHLAVARDYAAWQEHSARTPQVDVVSGFRNQLKMAPDVLKPTAPKPGGLDNLMSDAALEEAMR